MVLEDAPAGARVTAGDGRRRRGPDAADAMPRVSTGLPGTTGTQFWVSPEITK
ncbi:MAG: hypothetical protein M5U08_22760 [Burkholderiales bacterium]|nr:hypothetical protein [Burkholderiales bacterium]